MSIQVIKAGALTSVQDLGRYGYQRFGVPVNGAMDEWSHRLANRLVGNPETEATLECTLTGPSLLFKSNQLISICGADLSPTIDRRPFPQGRPVLVRAGAQLDFGKCERGARTYIAVSGGYQIASVMDSKSTYLRGAFGGFSGRALQKGDVIKIGMAQMKDCYLALSRVFNATRDNFVAPSWAAVSTTCAPSPGVVRVIAGQQWQAFTEEAQKKFTSATFCISAQSDRMGYRMEGVALALRQPIEMISEAVCFGTIQVPPDGNPIVLMADRQTTGGYPKIAQVATVDLPLLAQMLPQQKLRFVLITLEQAQQLYLEREREIQQIQWSIDDQKKMK